MQIYEKSGDQRLLFCDWIQNTICGCASSRIHHVLSWLRRCKKQVKEGHCLLDQCPSTNTLITSTFRYICSSWVAPYASCAIRKLSHSGKACASYAIYYVLFIYSLVQILWSQSKSRYIAKGKICSPFMVLWPYVCICKIGFDFKLVFHIVRLEGTDLGDVL